MRVDPRLIEQNRKWNEARASYTASIQDHQIKVWWPMLSPKEQRDYYDSMQKSADERREAVSAL